MGSLAAGLPGSEVSMTDLVPWMIRANISQRRSCRPVLAVSTARGWQNINNKDCNPDLFTQ